MELTLDQVRESIESEDLDRFRAVVDALSDEFELVDVALLQRFPRCRGNVSANERYWCVPDKVDATRYVEMVDLSTDDDGTDADVQAAALRRAARQSMGRRLPSRSSFLLTAKLIKTYTSLLPTTSRASAACASSKPRAQAAPPPPCPQSHCTRP
jgi:hypothetical protein